MPRMRWNIDEAKALADAGLTCYAIGKKLGVNPNTVYAAFRQRKWPFPKPKKLSKADVATLLAQGLNDIAIAERLNRSFQTITTSRRRMGLPSAQKMRISEQARAVLQELARRPDLGLCATLDRHNATRAVINLVMERLWGALSSHERQRVLQKALDALPSVRHGR